MEWYPFYPALYRAHTIHLTAEQDGIYRRLIDYYMESRQPLPDNDFALARIAGVDIDCFKHASSILKAFFKQSNGLLYHQKCDELLDEQDSKSKFYEKRAKKAAAIRHGKTKTLCLKHATSNSQALLGDATVTVNSKIVSKDTISPYPLPDWIPLIEWEAFKDMRKSIKKPMTPHAEKLAIAKLEKYRNAGHDPAAILNQSILNGWQDIFQPREQTNAAHSKLNTSYNQPSKTERLYAAARRAAEAAGIAPEFGRQIEAGGNASTMLPSTEDIR